MNIGHDDLYTSTIVPTKKKNSDKFNCLIYYYNYPFTFTHYSLRNATNQATKQPTKSSKQTKNTIHTKHRSNQFFWTAIDQIRSMLTNAEN